MNSESTVPPQASETLWYYADANNQPVGPLPMAELQRLAASGVISPKTQVVEEGGDAWRTFAEIIPKSSPGVKPAPQWQMVISAVLRELEEFLIWMWRGVAGIAADLRKSAPLPQANTPPNYKRRLLTILALVFLFPVGLWMLWRNNDFSKRTKILVTSICSPLFLALLFQHDVRKGPNQEHKTMRAERSSQPTVMKTCRVSDFILVIPGPLELRIGVSRIRTLTDMIEALYYGKVSEQRASRYAFTRIEGDFASVAGEYVIFTVESSDDRERKFQFAMQRNPELESKYGSRNLESCYYRPRISDLIPEGQKAVMIVGIKQFSTVNGFVKIIPIVQAIRLLPE